MRTRERPEARFGGGAPATGNWPAVAAVAVITALAILVGNWWVGAQAEADGSSQVEVAGALAPPRVGDPAPGFTAVDLDGGARSLAALRGKPVWVLFMASWCAQCRVEAPDVQQAHLERDDVHVVAVYLSEDQQVAGDYARRVGLTFTQVPDPAAEISAAYGVRAIPAHYFVDARGVVRDVAVGALSESQIETHLDRLVGPAT
ncbi:TlpA family protein disulfide reductase [Tessaracoccus oleiagri]|uniref:Peroxiredoxin n=1 Tax=Tessaracoccus oleiagri TaxID=686624 RepID=A0A1G9H5E5_9ACTN|nr:TlpA disulfide reductase family protein [Tessaracoccus oleiagri]SDL08004.1 Peroxiredoxin [Tessaracoccus oleiagri]